MRLYLIRHGMPDYSTDTLTELGVHQAKKLGDYYKDIKFDLIFCSSHGRAIETAKFLAKPHAINPIIQNWSREDIGARYFTVNQDGKSQWVFWDEVCINNFRKNEVISSGKNWVNNPLFINKKFDEGYNLMAKDLDEFMEKIGLKHDRERNCFIKIKDLPENVALVAHGGFAYSFISNLLDIPYPIFSTTVQCMDLTGVTIIDFEEVGDKYFGRIKTYNETSHLRENKTIHKLEAGV